MPYLLLKFRIFTYVVKITHFRVYLLSFDAVTKNGHTLSEMSNRDCVLIYGLSMYNKDGYSKQ